MRTSIDLLLFIFTLSYQNIQAKIELGPTIQAGAVIQTNVASGDRAQVWGFSDQTATDHRVKVQCNTSSGHSYTYNPPVNITTGLFVAQGLIATVLGDCKTLSFDDGDPLNAPIVLTDVIFGDVILCIGDAVVAQEVHQSQNCTDSKSCPGSQSDGAVAWPENIRLFLPIDGASNEDASQSRSTLSSTSLNSDRSWKRASPADAHAYPAACWYAAASLRAARAKDPPSFASGAWPNVPIGIFAISESESGLFDWSPAQARKECTVGATGRPSASRGTSSGVAWTKHIEPMLLLRFRFAVWSTGLVDAGIWPLRNSGDSGAAPLPCEHESEQGCLLRSTINAWRDAAGFGDFPVLVIGLPTSIGFMPPRPFLNERYESESDSASEAQGLYPNLDTDTRNISQLATAVRLRQLAVTPSYHIQSTLLLPTVDLTVPRTSTSDTGVITSIVPVPVPRALALGWRIANAALYAMLAYLPPSVQALGPALDQAYAMPGATAGTIDVSMRFIDPSGGEVVQLLPTPSCYGTMNRYENDAGSVSGCCLGGSNGDSYVDPAFEASVDGGLTWQMASQLAINGSVVTATFAEVVAPQEKAQIRFGGGASPACSIVMTKIPALPFVVDVGRQRDHESIQSTSDRGHEPTDPHEAATVSHTSSPRAKFSGSSRRLNKQDWLETERSTFSNASHAPHIRSALPVPVPGGWETWNDLHSVYGERLIRRVADAMAAPGPNGSLSLVQSGYTYVIVDEWSSMQRDTAGRLVPNPTRFPSGMANLTAYIRSKGLKAGIYTCQGYSTCQGFASSCGHEELDAHTFFDEWGAEYVFVDSCGGCDPETEWKLWHQAAGKYAEIAGKSERDSTLNEGVTPGPGLRPLIEVHGCQTPHAGCGLYVSNYSDLWRVAPDLQFSFDSVVSHIDAQLPMQYLTSPQGQSYADMLIVGDTWGSPVQEETHFLMWAVFPSPLILGNDVAGMDARTRTLVTSPEVLAINHDPLAVPAMRVQGGPGEPEGTAEAWSRPLEGGDVALALFNRWDVPSAVNVTWQVVGHLPRPSTGCTVRARDALRKRELGNSTTGWSQALDPYQTVLLRLSPTGCS